MRHGSTEILPRKAKRVKFMLYSEKTARKELIVTKKLEPDYDSAAIQAMGKKVVKPNVDLAKGIGKKLAASKRIRSGKPGMTLRQFTGVIEEAVKIVPAKKLPRD